MNLNSDDGVNHSHLAIFGDKSVADPRVEHSMFHTSELKADVRFSAWKESIGVMFEVERPHADQGTPFDARMDSLLLDDIMLARSVAGAQSFFRDNARIVNDSLDHYMFQVFDKGHVDMHLGDKVLRGQSGMMISGDLAEPLTSENSDYALISVFVPRARLDPYLRNTGMVHGATINTQTGSGRLLAEYMQTLNAIGRNMTRSAGQAASQALVILIAAACNDASVNHAVPPEWADHALLLKVQAVIAEHLGDSDLDVARIAALTGLSRSRLYRLFRPHGGIMQIVKKQRLRRARSQLVARTGPNFRISEIAYRCGFADPAQFSRAFRKQFGCSPREARIEGRRFIRHKGEIQGLPIGDRKYEEWVDALG